MCRYILLKSKLEVLSLTIPDIFSTEYKIIPISDDQELNDFLKSEYQQNPNFHFSMANYSSIEKRTNDSPNTSIISLKQGDYYFVYKQREIIHIEASGSYSVITMLEQKLITVTFNLADIEPKLSKETFIRIHKSVIVNIDYITKFIGNTIYLNNKNFPVGRKFKKALVTRLNLLGNLNRLFRG